MKFFVPLVALLSLIAQIQAQEAKIEITSVRLAPVYLPSAERGVVAVVIPRRVMLTAAAKSAGVSIEELEKKLLLGEKGGKPKWSFPTNWTATLMSGKTVKVVAVNFAANQDNLYVYLGEAVSEIPSMKVDSVEVVGGQPSQIDPATIASPKAITLLGFQPSAPLLDGGTSGVYQIGVNMPFGENIRLQGVLSSSFMDKQANLGLEVMPAKGFKVSAVSSQLGTTQTVTAGYEQTQSFGPFNSENFKGEVAPRFAISNGLYFAKQLRVDSNLSASGATGSGVYGQSSLNLPVVFDSSGFMRFNLNLNMFLFPGSTADQFGVKTFEPSYDLGVLFPIQRPSQLRNGSYADNGLWLKLGFIGGVQPANGFGQVNAFRFDIVKSF